MDRPLPEHAVDPAQLEPLCSLDDPTRHRLYDHVAAQPEPVTRDQASTALDLERSTAAYHLDRLVDEGLLVATFARPEGRGGPGAGRPAKHYQRSDHEFSVSVPRRDYALAAEVLARAVEADGTGAVREALARAAAELGHELTAEGEDASSRDLLDSLAAQGFEPFDDGDAVRLRNCPFHRLAQRHTELVCGMNLAMLQGLAEATASPFEARLDAAPGRCCVAFVARGGRG